VSSSGEDAAVYRLDDLSAEEITIVEKSAEQKR